jgi:aryl sulfotransferase
MTKSGECPLLKPQSPTHSRKYAGNFSDPTRWNAFAPRVGDIVVVTPPKSGTTWTQSILALLISGDPDVEANAPMKTPWIDFNVRDLTEVMGRLEAQDHRRQIKTHTPFNGIPFWTELRYVAVYRHPIDVYFSFRKHAMNLIREISDRFFPKEYFSDNVSDGFRVFLEGDFVEAASLSAIVDHYRSTLMFEPHDNILRLHYADMLRDLPGAFDRIAAHTSMPHSPDVVVKLVQAATFDNMKANAHRFTPSAGQGLWQNDAAFFDSASSNKWEGKLSEAEIAAYDARISELLKDDERQWLEWGSACTTPSE